MRNGNFREILAHALTARRKQIVCALGAILLLALAIQPWISTPWVNWWGWLEPITGIATLVIAIFVWWEEIGRNWEESLPKKLTVSFYYKDWLVMRCEEAYLASVSDIRAWAQQLGRQMASNQGLEFEPFIIQRKGVVDETKSFKLYCADYTLTKLPEAYQDRYKDEFNAEISDDNFSKKAEEGALGCIHWFQDDNGLKNIWIDSELRGNSD